VILVVVIVVVSIIAYLLLASTPAPAVQVSEIAVWAPDNVCGLLANPLYFGGYNTSANENDSWQLYGWQNYNSTACTIQSVTTNTTGFSLNSIQVPLTIPGGDQNASINLTVEAPGSSYSGPLNLVFA
jgi:uncharacterized membrane protein